MMATPKIPFKSRLLRLCTGGKPNASEGAKRSAQMAAHIPNSKRLSAPRCHSSRNANAMVHKAAPSAGKLLLNSRKLSQEATAKNTIMTATNAVYDCDSSTPSRSASKTKTKNTQKQNNKKPTKPQPAARW